MELQSLYFHIEFTFYNQITFFETNQSQIVDKMSPCMMSLKKKKESNVYFNITTFLA